MNSHLIKVFHMLTRDVVIVKDRWCRALSLNLLIWLNNNNNNKTCDKMLHRFVGKRFLYLRINWSSKSIILFLHIFWSMKLNLKCFFIVILMFKKYIMKHIIVLISFSQNNRTEYSLWMWTCCGIIMNSLRMI